jgi:hypothetical protein
VRRAGAKSSPAPVQPSLPPLPCTQTYRRSPVRDEVAYEPGPSLHLRKRCSHGNLNGAVGNLHVLEGAHGNKASKRLILLLTASQLPTMSM